MSHFKAKMHQIPFRLGLRPRHQYSTPRPISCMDLRGILLRGGRGMEGRGGEGPTYKGREGRAGRREGERREKDGRGGEGKWRGYL